MLLTPACGRLAARLGIFDFPSARKVHRHPTPLLGGVAVYLAFAVSTVVFLKPVREEQMLLLLAGAAAFGVIGLLDDLWNAGAWKLAVEGAVVVAIVWLGGVRLVLPWPYMGEVLAILWVVGVANALNCLDCTDGAAGGTVAVSALVIIPLAVLLGRWGVAVAAAAVAGSAVGFLRYNFPPARVFLGDAGSLMLGFVVAMLGATLVAPEVHHSMAAWAAPILILGVPTSDFLFVHARRYLNGVRDPLRILTSTGKDHLPHRLRDAGLSDRQVALWLYSATALMGGSAVFLVLWGPVAAAFPLGALLATGAAGRVSGSLSPVRVTKTGR